MESGLNHILVHIEGVHRFFLSRRTVIKYRKISTIPCGDCGLSTVEVFVCFNGLQSFVLRGLVFR